METRKGPLWWGCYGAVELVCDKERRGILEVGRFKQGGEWGDYGGTLFVS